MNSCGDNDMMDPTSVCACINSNTPAPTNQSQSSDAKFILV